MTRRLVPVAAVLVTAAMLGVLLHLLTGVGSIGSGFSVARIDASQTANAQRDLLTFQSAVLRLPVTGDVEGAELRRDLLLQQLDVLRQRGRDDVLQTLIERLQALDVDGLVTGVDHDRRLVALDEQLTTGARHLKVLYDGRDQGFHGLIDHALTERKAAQRLLATLVLFTLASLAAWGVQFRRRSLGDLATARREKQATEQRFHSLVRNSSDLTLMVDGDGAITWASPAACEVTGRSPETLVGTPLVRLVHHEDAAAVQLAAAREPGRHDGACVAFRLRHVDGTVRHVESTVSDLRADGDVGAVVLNVRDVTDRRQLEDELSHLAYHDPLTGLPNRALLRERLEAAVDGGRRGPRRSGMALLLVDLDDFKAVNDGLGHDHGDRLLVEVAQRLLGCTRPTDTVARLGGDEFVVFAPHVNDLDAASILSERVSRALAEPMVLGSHVVPVGASIGVRYVEDPALRAEHVMRDADIAMYAAKGAGKGTWAMFEDEMHDRITEQLRVRGELRRAIDEGEVVLHYQPIVDAATEHVTGFEALVRWEHPEEGLLGPHRFIDVAEETGLIVPLGDHVIREAAFALRRLQLAAGRDDLTMAVNISPRQLELSDVVTTMALALRDAGVDPTRFIAEVTEGVFLDDTVLATERIGALRSLGVQLALDDFGTGYSSLSYVERLPLDVLKIDRSFVSSLGTDPSRAALVDTIVRLGSVLGLRTVAEGVETPDELACLQQLGCSAAQGWLFGRPVPETEAHALLAGDPNVSAV